MKNTAEIIHMDHKGGIVETYNPATGELLHTYRKHSREEAEKVIEKAHEAYKEWRDISIDQRAKVIRKMGELLKENTDELAEMMARQMGKPVSQGKEEVKLCARICEHTADCALELLKDERRETEKGSAIISYEPLGVILAMQPWNFPVYQVIRYAAAVLMGGNTTVLKHAEICWKTAEKLKELFEDAGLPKDAFGLLLVDDQTVDSLIEHKNIRGVTLTGSAEAGSIVAEKSGKAIKKTLLELGGSDPYIIVNGVDLDEVVPICVQGRINNAGQTCVAAKRFIIEESIYETFKEKFVAAMKKTTYGDPIEDTADMGPLARYDLREKLHNQVMESIVKGAKCLTGGEIPSDEKGYYYPATVLENIQPGMPAYDGELFGPVASLFKAKDLDDAVRIANDHKYGLGGGVFCPDEDKALKIAKRIETGMVNINTYALAQPEIPFGGVKDSGYGREHGGFGLREFVNIKSIVLKK